MAEIKANAETYRLAAITKLLRGDLNQARLEISKARELAPSWESVRFTEAVLGYFSALSGAMVPHQVVAWPEPIDRSFFKADDDTVMRLREAAKVFSSLSEMSDASSEERKNYETWYLACLANDPEKEDLAKEYCRKLLQTDPSHYRVLLWGIAREWDIDIDHSIRSLEKLAATDQAKPSHIVALTAYYLTKQKHVKAANLLKSTRKLFKSEPETSLWNFWYSQCLAGIKDSKKSLKGLEALRRRKLSAQTRRLIENSILARQGEWRKLADRLESDYELTKDARFLLEACELHARNSEWQKVADRASELVKSGGTIRAVRLAGIATFHSKRYKQCLEILENNLDLFTQRKLPTDLRRLRIRTLQELGVLPEALVDAEKLASDEPTTENLVGLARLHYDFGNLKGVASVGQKLVEQPDLTVQEHLELCRVILPEDHELSKQLWLKARAKGIPENLVGLALETGLRLGLEKELRPYFEQLPRLATSGLGGFQKISLQEIIKQTKSWREHREQVIQMYERGEIPIHIAADSLNVPLVKLFHQLLSDNQSVSSSRGSFPLYVRSGARNIDTGFIEKNAELRLVIDITSILLAVHLEFLDAVEQSFSPLWITAELIPSLTQMKDSLQPIQPRRLIAFKTILDLVQNGKMKLDGSLVPKDPEKRYLIDQMGEEWVAILEQAHANGGYVVDYLPLQMRNLSGQPPTISKEDSQYLVDIRSVLDSIRQFGPLSEMEFNEAIEALGTMGQTSLSSHVPVQGKPLYCVANIPEVIAQAGILDVLCGRFEVHLASSEYESLQRELRENDRNQELLRWLENVISRINLGTKNGIYSVLPESSLKDSDDNKIPVNHSSTRSLLSLLKPKAKKGDVLWIDDRTVNNHVFGEGAPIIGLNEILTSLNNRGVISTRDYFEKIIELRASDARFIPLSKEEILFHLSNAIVDDKELNETKELRVLRRYVANCILRGELLLRPNQKPDSPNQFGESPFLLGTNRAITDAIVEAWKDVGDKEQKVKLQADWILDQLYIDHLGLLKTSSIAPAEMDEHYVMAIGISGLISQAILLPYKKEGEKPSVRQRYFEWLNNRLLAKRFYADHFLVAAIADVLKKTMLSMTSRKGNKRETEATIFLVQRFYEDLPTQLVSELSRDSEFLTKLGIKARVVTSLDDMKFDPDEFNEAAFNAINGREATVYPLDSKERIIFKPIQDVVRKASFCYERPSTGASKIVVNELSEVLLESPIEREEALRKHLDWFDCEEVDRNTAIAEIVATANLSDRIEKARKWQESSMTVFYSELYRRLTKRGQFSFDELVPRDIMAILRHLRVSLDEHKERNLHDRRDVAAKSLLKDLGLIDAIRRLAGLPIPLPQTIMESINALSEKEHRALIKALLRSVRSPVSRSHFIFILLNSKYCSEPYVRLARRALRSLMDKDYLTEFQSFRTLLQWTEEELGHLSGFKSLSSEDKLLCVWCHGNNVFNIFVSAGVPQEWIITNFQIRRIPHGAFDREQNYWQDVAHPRKIHRVPFLLAALFYGFGTEHYTLIDQKFQLALNELCFPKTQEVDLPEINLLLDTTMAKDALGSFLGVDRGKFAALILQSENANKLGEVALGQLAEHCLDALEKERSSPTPWMLLHAIWGDYPPPRPLIERFRKTLDETNFAQLYELNSLTGDFAILLATQQEVNLDDPGLWSKLRGQMLTVARRFTALPREEPGDIDSKRTANLGPEGALIESALNLSNCLPDADIRAKEFSKLMTELCDIWPGLLEKSRSIFQRFVEELPISEAQYFWPLILRSRLI